MTDGEARVLDGARTQRPHRARRGWAQCSVPLQWGEALQWQDLTTGCIEPLERGGNEGGR